MKIIGTQKEIEEFGRNACIDIEKQQLKQCWGLCGRCFAEHGIEFEVIPDA